MSVMKCNNCNKKISEDDKKCPKCGVTTERGEKDNYIIGFVVAFGVIILIFIVLAASKSLEETSVLVGTWESEKEFSDNSYNNILPQNKGVETKIYTFDKNGKCVENTVKKGTKTYTRLGKKIEEPFKNETTYYYTYEIDLDNNILKLFDYEYYEEDLKEYNSCIQYDDCELERPIKSDYEEEYTLTISDAVIFIDDEKFEKK